MKIKISRMIACKDMDLKHKVFTPRAQQSVADALKSATSFLAAPRTSGGWYAGNETYNGFTLLAKQKCSSSRLVTMLTPDLQEDITPDCFKLPQRYNQQF